MKKSIYLVAAGSLLFGSASWACTAEDANAKAQEFDAAVAELSKTDPVKAVTLSAKVTDEQTRQASEGADTEAMCAMYDELLAELGGAPIEAVEEPEVSLDDLTTETVAEDVNVEALAEEPGR